MSATDVWVGVDAGKSSHHAVAIDAGGKKLWTAKVTNGQQQIEELINRAAKTVAKTGGQVRWAVDLVSPAASLLLTLLLTTGQKVVYVPGRVVNGMAGVFRGEGKTDAKDARIIADTARMRGDLTELSPTDELVVELTRLTAYRADVMADWVRGVNRLRDLLSGIFPALERSFDFSTRSALILVSGYCTPAEAFGRCSPVRTGGIGPNHRLWSNSSEEIRCGRSNASNTAGSANTTLRATRPPVMVRTCSVCRRCPPPGSGA